MRNARKQEQTQGKLKPVQSLQRTMSNFRQSSLPNPFSRLHSNIQAKKAMASAR
jgi:hypothetical protein